VTEFEVPYLASDFPSPAPFDMEGSLKVTWEDLLHAAITVGRWRKDVLSHGRYSVAEVAHRAMCFRAYLDIDDGALRHTSAYRSLDPTEKGLVSYYVGMAACKLFAHRCLGVQWLMHISRYEAQWAVTYSGTSRPDLFGCNASGQWLVAEAKGRMRTRESLVSTMQQQKSSVASVAGQVPSYRIGTATRFPRGSLALRVVDPPAKSRAEDVPLNPGAWLLDYYAPIVDLIESSDPVSEDGGRYAVIPGTDVQVGLPESTIAMVSDRRKSANLPRPAPKPSGVAALERVGVSLVEQAHEQDRPWIAELTASVAQRRFSDGVDVRQVG
jgi:hypothetical protein